MIGVVVWSSQDREKAVIWCDDHGALAYLSGADNLASPEKWPGAGDLVSLETEMIGCLRHARKVSMLEENGCPTLPKRLKSERPVDAPRLRLVAAREYPRIPTEADHHRAAAAR